MSAALRPVWTRACLLLAGATIAAAGPVQTPPPTESPPAQQSDAAPKPEPPANGAISGTVINGATGKPVMNALVTLQPGVVTKPLTDVVTRQLTDERGRLASIQL